MHWKLNRLQYPVYSLGPGTRIAIWVQGCTIGCPDCINPELWDPQGGRPVDPAVLAAELVSFGSHFDGITITGGEPFDQYAALVAFGTFIRQKTGMNILVYSGYTLTALKQKFPDHLFAGSLDFLVSGPYIATLACDDGWRGSSNQKFYQFENGNPRAADPMESGRSFSFQLTPGRKLFMAGIPGAGDLKQIGRRMCFTGIKFNADEVQDQM